MKATNTYLNESAGATDAGHRSTNVGRSERWLSLLGGGALTLGGLNAGGIGGLVVAALGGGLIWRGFTGHCPVYQRLGRSTADRTIDRPGVKGLLGSRDVDLEAAITINRSPEDLYDYWRRVDNAPEFMRWVESVTPIDQRRSRWAMRVPPTDKVIEWTSEIVEDVEGELIAWRSVQGAALDHSGEVRFTPAPGGRGTEVRVKMHLRPPGGALSAGVMRLAGHLSNLPLREDLRRLRFIMESGEVATTDGQPSGREQHEWRM